MNTRPVPQHFSFEYIKVSAAPSHAQKFPLWTQPVEARISYWVWYWTPGTPTPNRLRQEEHTLKVILNPGMASLGILSHKLKSHIHTTTYAHLRQFDSELLKMGTWPHCPSVKHKRQVQANSRCQLTLKRNDQLSCTDRLKVCAWLGWKKEPWTDHSRRTPTLGCSKQDRTRDVKPLVLITGLGKQETLGHKGFLEQ